VIEIGRECQRGVAFTIATQRMVERLFRVKTCPSDCAGSTSGVPEITADPAASANSSALG
jgi:hypothetical protein